MFSVVIFCLVTLKTNCLCSYLPPILKTTDFIELRESPIFIDKTLQIFKIINNDEPLILTAPPGFGKSSNLDMLRVFLSNTVNYTIAQEMFSETNVAKDGRFMKTHLGNHPVIQCSFEPTSSVTDYNTMVANFRVSLHKAFTQHQYLASSKQLADCDRERFKKFVGADSHASLEPSEISSGLHFLSKALKTHHGKPVVLLIDDYDSVIWISLMTQTLGIRDVLGFYDAIFSTVLSDKENVKKSILTGTSGILCQLLPSLRNIKCVKFLHDKCFDHFFGLTGDEVDYLMDRSLYVSLVLNMTEWYNGYTSPDLSSHIYNTKSLLSFMCNRGELQSYWNNEQVQKSLRILLEDNERRGLLMEIPENVKFIVRNVEEINEEMLEGVKRMINKQIWNADVSDLYIHLLMEQGYFTFDKPWERSIYNSSVTLKLANRDVCGFFQRFTADFIQERKKLRSHLKIE